MAKMSKTQRTAILQAHRDRSANRLIGVIYAAPRTLRVLQANHWAQGFDDQPTRAGLIAAGVDMDALHAQAQADRAVVCSRDDEAHKFHGYSISDACETPAPEAIARRRGPMPTVEYNGKVYKVRSRKTEIPDLAAMDSIPALMWLLRNTTPKGTNHRRPAPNLPNLPLTVR